MPLEVLVCVKRVPATGGRITVTADEQDIDTRFLGFTVSPHEECAVEEAVRLVERLGGATTVLTLGPEAAVEQLQDAMSIGIDRAILLQTDGDEWDAGATAAAIVDAVRTEEEAGGRRFDLLLFGNEAADTGDYQVGIRVAHALGLPCVSGVKALEVDDGATAATARREASGGWEVFAFPLPAVVTVKEGINLPRFPSLPGRVRARKREIVRVTPQRREAGGARKVRLHVPKEHDQAVEILGRGPDAVPRVIEVLRRLGVVP
jgi:electron transfer flavoprotein beta subunit